MLHSAKTLAGYKLDSLEGEIGRVEEFYFDDKYWVVRYLVAEAGNWLTGGHVLLSPYALGAVSTERHHIAVDLTKRLSEKATIEIRDAEACPAGPSAKSALSLWELRFPIISRGVRKLVDRAGFGMGDDPCSRDDGPCNGEGICPHPRPLSRRERGEKVQVITGKSAPLPAGEGLRGEGHPSPPWHWLIAF